MKKGYMVINPNDIIGTVIGKWTVLKYGYKELDMTSGGCRIRHWYLCKCSCGTYRYVRRDSLVQGLSRSCGCGKRKFKNYSKILQKPLDLL